MTTNEDVVTTACRAFYGAAAPSVLPKEILRRISAAIDSAYPELISENQRLENQQTAANIEAYNANEKYNKLYTKLLMFESERDEAVELIQQRDKRLASAYRDAETLREEYLHALYDLRHERDVLRAELDTMKSDLELADRVVDLLLKRGCLTQS